MTDSYKAAEWPVIKRRASHTDRNQRVRGLVLLAGLLIVETFNFMHLTAGSRACVESVFKTKQNS